MENWINYHFSLIIGHVKCSANRIRPLCDVNKSEPVSKLQADRSQPIRKLQVEKKKKKKMASSMGWICVSVLFFVVFLVSVHCQDSKPKKKKDIRDYNDADMARLLEQWEVIRFEHFSISILL